MIVYCYEKSESRYNDCKCDASSYVVWVTNTERGASHELGPCVKCYCEYMVLSRSSTEEFVDVVDVVDTS